MKELIADLQPTKHLWDIMFQFTQHCELAPQTAQVFNPAVGPLFAALCKEEYEYH